MARPRRFFCGEGEYLALHGIDLHHAARYHRRYNAVAIRQLHQAGIAPDAANAIEGKTAAEIIAMLEPSGAA